MRQAIVLLYAVAIAFCAAARAECQSHSANVNSISTPSGNPGEVNISLSWSSTDTTDQHAVITFKLLSSTGAPKGVSSSLIMGRTDTESFVNVGFKNGAGQPVGVQPGDQITAEVEWFNPASNGNAESTGTVPPP